MKLLSLFQRVPQNLKFPKLVTALSLSVIVLFVFTSFSSSDSTLPSAYMPGVVFEIETTYHTDSPPSTESSEAMVEGPNIKIPISSRNGSPSGDMIFRGDRGTKGEVIVTDDKRKGYYLVDDAFLKNMKGQMDKTKSMMDDVMKNLTKEQREMIEKAQKKSGNKMGQLGMMKQTPVTELRKTSDKGTKNGYPCVKYEVLRDGQKIQDLWVTDWSNIDGGDEAEDAFGAMRDFYNELVDSLGDFGNMGPYDEFDFAEGFPVVTMGYGDDGSLDDESWLKRTRRQRIDPSAFEPPSGYKRMSMGPR